jgi:16S rRNA (guanine527-N7)-methyltransferase
VAPTQYETYVALLARWNRRLNLTSLNIDPPDTAALDRLIKEPVRAASLIRPDDTFAVDLGAGGGSPALPLKITCPWLRFVLVESKSRKCAFLREAIRTLQLKDVEVENRRYEELSDARPELVGRADVVTFRAIKADEALWQLAEWLLCRSGQIIWFGGEAKTAPDGWRQRSSTEAAISLERNTGVA